MADVAVATNVHEWVSFPDPGEDRTWLFDVTFFASSWRCVYGDGCQGVLTGPAPERAEGCCSYGAHLVDAEDIEKVRRAAATLTAEQWQHRRRAIKHGPLTEANPGVTTTRLVDDACIFLNRPGFPGGPGCALHRAAIERGVSPISLKPDVCWQLPLRREDATDEGTGHVTSTITQWDRRHWGPAGEDFHWWCTEAPEAFSAANAVYLSLADEITELVGETAYAMLANYLDERFAEGPVRAHPITLSGRRAAT